MRPIDADDFRERMDMICDAGGYLQPITEAVREYVKIMIDRQPTVFEAITREQFAEAAKQLMNEFAANDGYGTSASATFLALCFGNLELRLFGMDGDSE